MTETSLVTAISEGGKEKAPHGNDKRYGSSHGANSVSIEFRIG
jgi:hypothetical protein